MNKDFQSRKQNRLENFNYNQNGAYFVTICIKERKKLLSDISVGDDALIVPKEYGLILEKYIRNVPEIEKYIIMPDHFHMIIRIDNGTMRASSTTNRIANIVRSIKTLTTKEIGKPIFQRSYYDHIIRNQDDHNEIWEYIENNPKKWMLTHNPQSD